MFYKIKSVSKKSGKGTVSVLYRQADFETLKSTGVSVDPSDFDMKSGKVKARVPEHPELNAKIQEVVTDLEVAARNVRRNYGVVTKTLLDKEYDVCKQLRARVAVDSPQPTQPVDLPKSEARAAPDSPTTARPRPTAAKFRPAARVAARRTRRSVSEPRIPGITRFTDRISDYLDLNPEVYRESTKLGYEDLRAILIKFRPATTIEAVDLEYLQALQAFMIKRGMRNQSVRVTFSRLKKVYRYFAEELDLPTAFLAKLKMVKELANDDVIFLNEEEVQAIASLPLANQAQHQIRQQFLFSCEVGLRHSDLYISRANVQGDRLHVTMQKSNRTVKPPLTTKAKEILDGPDFPFKKVCTNQYNKTLREICKQLPEFRELVTLTHYVGNVAQRVIQPKWRLISSHVGRKTAINKWLNRGVRETVVALWAGHRNTKMVEKYYQNREAASANEALKLE